MEQSFITGLFGKYLNNECSPAEVDQLLEWLEDPRNEGAQKELIRRQLSAGVDGSGYTDTALQIQLKDTLRSILQEINTKPIKRAGPFRLKWLRVAAAAAVVLMLGTGSFYFLSRNVKKDNGLSAVRAVAPPATSNAILTLANGTRIALDSADNGSLAIEGNARITKQADGQLVYEKTAADNNGPMYNTLTVPRGSKVVYIELADGSKVWLNTASSIRYPTTFTGSDREVTLSGEAYFDVAKDARRPFLVRTGNMQVQVLGTEFNLMAYPDEEAVQTTLVAGAIEVVKDKERKLVKPGQQAGLANGASSFRIGQADLRSVLAWKEGLFRFDGAGIGAIMRQMARWYDVEIVYEGTPPVEQFYGFLPRQEYASQILEALELTQNVHFRMEGKKIVVMAGPRLRL